MATLIHISDLHFGRTIPDVVAGLHGEIVRLDPEAVIISGDLTQRARSSQYRAGGRFLRQLGRKCHPVPGNHDLAAFNVLHRFFLPWRNWRKHISDSLEFVDAGRGYVAIGINTARRLAAPFDWSRGRISARQVEQVARVCGATSPQTLRILIAHHPFWLPAQHARRHCIGGGEQAWNVLRQAGIDIICGGHIHLAYVHLLDGIILSHAGTSASDRLLPETSNSFLLIRGDRSKIDLVRFGWSGDGFKADASYGFSRGEEGWKQIEDRSPAEHRENDDAIA